MRARVIAVANQKGGVGKTTTAISFAACLAERRRRVLLVDLDPQANATSGLGIPPQPGGSLYEALLGRGNAAERIQDTAVAHLQIVPSEVDLAGAEVEVARADRYLHRFRDALRPVLDAEAHEFIIVDCPPSLGILTMNALAAADAILVPTQCEYYALEGLSVIHRLIQQLRQSGANHGLELEGILMTMFDARTNLSQQVADEVRKHFGEKVFNTCIPRTVRLSEAPSHGQPITLYDPRSPGAEAYRAFTREFLRRHSLIRRVVTSLLKRSAGEGGEPAAPATAPSPPPIPETPSPSNEPSSAAAPSAPPAATS